VTVGKTYIGLVVGVLPEVEVNVAGNKAVSSGNKMKKTRQLCVSGENVSDCSEELSVRMVHNQAKNVLVMAVRIVTMVAGVAGVAAGRSRTEASIEAGAPSDNFGRLVMVAVGVVVAVVVVVGVAVVAVVVAVVVEILSQRLP
jgi:hypothetical protein